MALRETPTDTLSGMPLPIAPDPEGIVLAVMAGQVENADANGPLVDRNHGFHPRAEVLAGGDGSVALLNGRCQDVLRFDHNEYHAHCGGPRLPRTPAERCAKLILCKALFVPREALYFRRGKLVVDSMTEAEHFRLRTSGELRVVSHSTVDLFVRRFMLSQPLEGITPDVIDRFLALDSRSFSDAREQEYLADRFLTALARLVSAPVAPVYHTGVKKGLLDPSVPPSPTEFTKSIVVRSKKHVRAVVNEFTRRLAGQRERGLAISLGDLALDET